VCRVLSGIINSSQSPKPTLSRYPVWANSCIAACVIERGLLVQERDERAYVRRVIHTCTFRRAIYASADLLFTKGRALRMPSHCSITIITPDYCVRFMHLHSWLRLHTQSLSSNSTREGVGSHAQYAQLGVMRLVRVFAMWRLCGCVDRDGLPPQYRVHAVTFGTIQSII
jgi:hypothetical protein